ncbi:four-helix bundle copper-binding protein [Arthrobacter sp. Soc17.1.1.1]|uniref:four-helix bundle copper-binding protein n=1 Tax=Arthrobacter sp. Soc17.1.1.1 TaxID=3121277 RepID=UPI002FE49A1D
MSRTQQMMTTHPRTEGTPAQDHAVLAAITALNGCAQTCTSCTDACLADEDVSHMTACIRRNQDCADLCRVTADILTRRTDPHDTLIQQVLLACRTACNACAIECGKHDHPHCRICADTCNGAELALKDLLQPPSITPHRTA